MIKDNEPYLIEYNVRMGDPECQTILPRLNTDLLKIIKNTIDNRLDQKKSNGKKKKYGNCPMFKRLSRKL